LDDIEAKVDRILAQLDGMTSAETQQVTRQLADVADKLDAVGGTSSQTRPKPKVGGK
jgi:hypothetical protein